MTRIAMIAAMSKNRVIGRDNELPWHISADLKHFKRLTLGKPVVMGRKTFESIGRPLPGRTNIVVSGQSDYAPKGVERASSTEEALALAHEVAARDGVDEVMVIGGETLYRSLLPFAGRLYLTEVQSEVSGDAFFPELGSDWVCVEVEDMAENEWQFRFTRYERQKQVSAG